MATDETTWRYCPRCNGDGSLWVESDPPGTGHMEDPCTLCNGAGKGPDFTNTPVVG